MADLDDDTPYRPRTAVAVAVASVEAERLGDLQLLFLQLAADSGKAAARIESLEVPDRADVLSLYRRRVQAVSDHLCELLAAWP